MNRISNGAGVLVLAGAGFLLFYSWTEPRRQEEQRRTCASNLAKIGRGVAQYLQDNDGIYPRAWFGHDAGPSDAKVNYKWMDAVFPYVKQEELFNCPIDNISRPYHYRSGQNYGSYVINNTYSAKGDAQSAPPGQRWSKIGTISDTVLLMEGENNFQVTWPDAKHTPSIEGDNPFHFGSIAGRHGAGVYRSSTVTDCEGMLSTSVFNYLRRTKMIGGQKIYTQFTIEDD